MSMCLTVNMSLKRTIAENESSSRVCTSTVSKKPFSGKEREEEERKKIFRARRGGGGKTRSGTEKRCFHNLQSGHPAWRSADNCSIFSTVNDLDFLEARSAPAEEIRNA